MSSRIRIAIAAILIMGRTLAHVHASTRDVIRRTGWESDSGWLPPMQMPSPPQKIILIQGNKEESSSGGDKKEDKISTLLPIIMTLGPLILAAIMLPIFMSFFSGIMSFIKSLMTMKMMPSMAQMMYPSSLIPAIPVMPPQPCCSGQQQWPPNGNSAILPFSMFNMRGRQHTDAVAEIWSKLDDFVNVTGALGLSGKF